MPQNDKNGGHHVNTLMEGLSRATSKIGFASLHGAHATFDQPTKVKHILFNLYTSIKIQQSTIIGMVLEGVK